MDIKFLGGEIVSYDYRIMLMAVDFDGLNNIMNVFALVHHTGTKTPVGKCCKFYPQFYCTLFGFGSVSFYSSVIVSADLINM